MQGDNNTSLEITSKDAKCRSVEDSKTIHAFINDLGGHERVDALVVFGINAEARRRNWAFRLQSADSQEAMYVIGTMIRRARLGAQASSIVKAQEQDVEPVTLG